MTMSKSIKIRPGKFQSTIGFIAGCIFCCIGIFVVIPRAGTFGYIWTIFAILITITTGMNAFTKHGVATQTIEIDEELTDVDLRNFYTESEVEERLVHLKELFEKSLITESEYTAKKAEILKRL
jgi:flagellar motor component MotA